MPKNGYKQTKKQKENISKGLKKAYSSGKIKVGDLINKNGKKLMRVISVDLKISTLKYRDLKWNEAWIPRFMLWLANKWKWY